MYDFFLFSHTEKQRVKCISINLRNINKFCNTFYWALLKNNDEMGQ